MPLYAEAGSSKTYELPTEGSVQGVLAKVKDLGEVDTNFGKKHKVRFIWQVNELDSEKKRRTVVEQFTLSLHEKAALRKRIKSMFGKEPPAKLDLETLVGSNNILVIQHNEVEGKKYANIVAVLRLPEGTEKIQPVAYEEKKEQKEAAPAAPKSKAGTKVTDENPIEDSEIPW